MRFPLYVICCFPLVVFNIFSLYLIFVSLTNMYLCVFLLGLILYGTLCTSWTLVTISFPMLGKFSTMISSNIFQSLSFFWNPCNLNVGMFDVVPGVSETVLTSFHSFCCILFCSRGFHRSVLQVIYPLFCLSYSTIDSL